VPEQKTGPPNPRKKRSRNGAPPQYWMIVSSPDNFRKTRDHGFTLQGIKSRHRKRAETIRSGDRLLYYVTGRMAFAATCTVGSSVFEEHSHIWRSARREEDYPWRVRMRPDHILDEDEWVPAKELAYRLEYVRKWPPEHWTLAFQGHVHQLPQKDFKLIEDELRRTQGQRDHNHRGGRPHDQPGPEPDEDALGAAGRSAVTGEGADPGAG
jgi:predicted RNA-binding protein